MDLESAPDLREADESRPAKRARLDAPLGVTEEVQEQMEDDADWDDIYGIDGDNTSAKPATAAEAEVPSQAIPASEQQIEALRDGGEEVLQQEGLPGATGNAGHRAAHPPAVKEQESESKGEVDGIPADAIDTGDELVAQDEHVTGTDAPSTKILEGTADMETDAPHKIADLESEQREGLENVLNGLVEQSNQETPAIADDTSARGEAGALVANGDPAPPNLKPNEDPEFLAAAGAQKENKNAEWQFDSSDAESSSSSDSDSSSDDSDDSGSDAGYEMLDPATAAKMLMEGDPDEDEGKKAETDRQPRTANEKKEEFVPKPDVKITEETKITHLGSVDRVVENVMLVKAATSGEYQVLEAGSVLCNEKREVIGAVNETLGKVQEPIYIVTFTNAKEMEDLGLEYGAKVFYVDAHSTYVFTQPLKSMKGTDASNIHDEEVPEDDQEFSDDEAEAEFKRQKKAAKRGGRGGLSRSNFTAERAAGNYSGPPDSGPRDNDFVRGSDAPQQMYGGGGLSYDDEGEGGQEVFYSPLKRPDNLAEMMASGGGMPARGHSDRGRGRGRGDRGRGRGDRGRGRGGGRGGRGGHDNNNNNNNNRGGNNQANGHRGAAHSFPDRHNNDGQEHRQHSLPPKPHLSNPPATASQPPPTAAYQSYQQRAPAPTAQTYQFGGQTYQYGLPQQAPQGQAHYYSPQHPQQPQATQAQQAPTGPIPSGAYVNRAFWQQQQPQPPNYVGWGGQQQTPYSQPGAAAAYGAPQQQYPQYAQYQQYTQQQHWQQAQAGAQANGGAAQQQQGQGAAQQQTDLADVFSQFANQQK